MEALHCLCKRRKGLTAIYAVVMILVLCGFVSLGVDFARVQCAKAQLRAAADAAARAAVVKLGNGVTATQNAAVLWAGYNTVDGHSLVLDPNNDIDFGTWNTSNRTFSVLTGAARSGANAVRINAHLASSRSTAVHLTFAQLLGQSTCDVTASGIAMISAGYECVGINSLTFSGGSSDSYYSSSSTTGYNTSPNGSASLASNGLVTLSGGTHCDGNVILGPSGSTSLTGGSTVSGSTSTLSSALSYPNATAGTAATTNNNSSVSSSYLDASRNFDNGSANVTLSGGTYYFNNFKVNSGTLAFSGAATIYVTGVTTWDKAVSAYNGVPANLKVYVCGTGSFTTNGNNTFQGVVYAPQSSFTCAGGGSFVGSAIGLTLTVSGGGNFYCDQSYNGGGVSLVR